MAVRSSMTDLIARMRVMTGDTGTPVFSDQAIQDALDERRTDVVEAELRYRPSFTDPGLVVFHDFFAPRRPWEASVVLVDTGGHVLTPSTGDLIAAHWTFASGQGVPVYITGSFYDLWGTAASILEQWAAKVALEFDFATDQQTFDRTGKREGLLKVAAEFARKAVQPAARPAWRSLEW